jgi:hypothetical protein
LSAFDVRIANANKVRPLLTLATGYYISIPVFKLWPMKKLSNLLGQLWEADPNKSLWSLMAKAWSAMRDQLGKANVPLDKFFDIICPRLNLPSPDTYLQDQGWKLDVNSGESPILSRDYSVQPSASFSAGIGDMPLSVEDITSICQTAGYAQYYMPDLNTTSSTFLGRSVEQQAAASGQGARVTKRNNRRNKRETARQSGAMPMLREQIGNAHGIDTGSPSRAIEPSGTVAESTQFYNQLASLLSNGMAQDQNQTNQLPVQDQNHTDQFPFQHQNQIGQHPDQGNTAIFAASDASLHVSTHWNAFRLGADENATLPPFDLSNAFNS